MKKIFTLLLLEIKRALQALPQLLCGAIVLSFLIGTIAFCSGKFLYHTAPLSTITIDLVVTDHDEISPFVIHFISGMESTNGLFHFQTSAISTAYEHLAEGSSHAIMVLPEQMLSNIMNGTNQPIQVILPDSSDLSSFLLQELTNAGAKTLSSAQAGIYTVTDLYVTNDLQSFLEESYRAIDKINLRYALVRDNLFHPISTSVTGNITVLMYYAASGILLFLLLWGITCSHFLLKETSAFYLKLRCASISGASYLWIKWMAVFLAYLVGLLSIFLAALFANLLFFKIKPEVPILSLFSFLLLLLFVASFVVLVFQLAKTSGSGILLLFLSSVLLMFLSGAFIPTAFFPASVRQFSAYLPTTFAMRQITGIFLAEPSFSTHLALVFYMLLFYLLSVFIQHKREVTHR